jgi:tetratricopeptide (TPR) repeat protein
MTQIKCSELIDDLAAIIGRDEQALARHGEHLAACDACRDVHHQAVEAAARVAEAGADFVVPAELEARVLAALDGNQRAPHPTLSPQSGERARGDSLAAQSSVPLAPRSGERVGARGIPRPWAIAFAVMAAASVTILLTSRPGSGPGAPAAGPSARVEQIARAAPDGKPGLLARAPKGSELRPVAPGETLPPGATLRTDERTRARLRLSDGSVIVLGERTEIALDERRPRRVELAGGELAADVAHLEPGPGAVFGTEAGTVEVLGTRFVLVATPGSSSVRVARGAVRVRSARGAEATVSAGQEGLLRAGAAPEVMPAVQLAESFRFSELGDEPGAEPALSGLGTLRARKPGEARDRERPLLVQSHKVRVRIVANVARTEIEEVFRNDGGDTLEGIYTFPLPADASIERLALDVNGRLEEGSFVESRRASAIWRGVIRHATPEQQRKPVEEYVWVPGPWRDPALLQWQKGGRIELRIFPIPARGSRRVVLAYTQTLAPYGKGRRYVYPLPHSADPALRVGRFELEARVAGVDPAVPVVARGLDLASQRDGEATRLSVAEDAFVPAGDILIDYALPQESSPVRWWTYEARDKQKPGEEAAFVTFALRPELPAWTESRPRDFVLLVDSSQSMVGERYARAARLAVAVIGELDRRDRVQVLACDVTCRAMSGEPAAPTAATAREAGAWLEAIRPAGASDLGGALAFAGRAGSGARAAGRDLDILYIGDGTPTVGHRQVSSLAAAAAELHAQQGARVSTAGVGSDADALRLGAIARAGGGRHLPYVPGQKLGEAALAILESSYGVAMTDVEITLPPGVTEIAPSRFPTLRAGEELLVSGRFAGGELRGEVVVRGQVAGQAHVERHPVELRATAAAGNAFLPRLWAQQTIEALELEGRGEDRARVVELSKRYGVLSRDTSLLVLESDAMFHAFGVERTAPAQRWTGEEDMEVAMVAPPAEPAPGRAARLRAAAPEAHAYRPMGDSDSALDGLFGSSAGNASRGGGGYEGDWPHAAPKDAKRDYKTAGGAARAPSTPPVPLGGRRGRYMRKVWYQVADVSPYGIERRAELAAVERAEAALALRPDSRDRHRALVQALSRAGDLARAEQAVSAWLGRDPMDAEALAALADLAARRGRRDEALRLLSGTLDVEPESKALHERLALAYERIHEDALGCAHRIALAEIAGDAAAVGAALRCERAQAHERAATALLAGLADPAVRLRAEEVAARALARPAARGPVVVVGRWTAGADLDIALIGPRGNRLSFMGGSSRLVADFGAAPDGERLGLGRIASGGYVVEISRTSPGDGGPVQGELVIEAFGNRRSYPFVLSGDHAPVARLDVRRDFRLEPL